MTFPTPKLPANVAAPSVTRHRLLIFIVAYHAERTIKNVLSRIPVSLAEQYDTEVLIIDDASNDKTFERSRQIQALGVLPFVLTILYNPVNQGYGGNQKIGYFYATQNGFDFVALLHGDGQYAPECLPDLVRPISEGRAAACFGSRMMTRGDARRGGMLLYKFVGNRVLTWFENALLGTSLSEFHSGYRVYATAALKRIPFELNTNGFHFDTEIIIQLFRAGLRIVELPIPTYYGGEISHVNGLKYAWNVASTVLKARAQDFGIFYDSKFDCSNELDGNEKYKSKLDFESSHSIAVAKVLPQSKVLDLGCAGGEISAALRKQKNCHVVGVDSHRPNASDCLDDYLQHDLNKGLPKLPLDLDYIMLLDVIEHLVAPEKFVSELRHAIRLFPKIKIIVSTPNIAFIVTRVMLMFGQFNYGKRGILDMTHMRLFTFSSLRALLEQRGFQVTEVVGVPAPFPLALGNGKVAGLLIGINKILIHLSKRLFSYQVLMVAQPRTSLEFLLKAAEEESKVRVSARG